MIKPFVAIENSTIWDVVNNTYGSINDIVKLMRDNNFPNVDTYPVNGQVFLFDDTLVQNQNNIQTNPSPVKFSTRERTSTNSDNMIKYEQNFDIDYTSNADGSTVIVIPELVGKRIVQIEKEIKPLKSSEYSFNSPAGQITLLGGLTLDADQTIYIIYAAIATS